MELTADKKEQALALCRLGVGKVRAEAQLMLRSGALRAEMARDPEFAQAWQDAQEDAAEAVEEALRDRALEGDTTAATAYLKARGGKAWKPDKADSGSGQGMVLAITTPEAMAELAARLERRQAPALARAEAIVDVESSEA